MEFDETRYTHNVPYPDDIDTRAAIRALDNEPLTVADRAEKARAIKAQAESERRLKMKAWGDAQEKVMDLFRADAEDEYGFAHLSDEVKGKIHSAAWEQGHDSGLYAVWWRYTDIAEIAVAAFNCGKATKRLPQPMKGEG